MDISVIIPVYNSASTITESINSVVMECILNKYIWELIVIDDGSKDNSVEIIKNYIASSPYKANINLITQQNGGAAVARNTGIKASKGIFIAFNDSDDRWLSGKLKLQMEYLVANPDVVLLGGKFGNDNMNRIKKLGYETVITIKDQVFKNYFSPPAILMRRSVIEKTFLFCEQMRYAEEGYFFNNIVYNGKSVFLNHRVSEPILSKERWGDCGLSGNLFKMEQGELFNIKSAYHFKYISFGLYFLAVNFSFIKFVRRLIISRFRKLCK